ncbi:acetyltransferase [Francisella adeliensis]|uniref:Acyltransferase n=1 Tax=Francisella adeliensis TaxID=2007306 RepID=A0ABX6KC60_9GAMM|nr:acetyltransferase [Francisella adeliensis]MBK2086064.1 1-acyl-sn-glycerol-3-phosphate acyltransferase [Francisella adeliensis]QIW11275.1 acyltransferase [Francisella adeliensis]
MLKALKYAYYGLFSIICLLINSAIVFLPVIFFSVLKLIIPIKSVKYHCTTAVQALASFWVSFAILVTELFSPTEIEFEQNAELRRKNSYLIISNHKSWLDTLILILAFHKKIAFPKFFMKFQMFFVPLIGIVCWALEFPAMKRYSKEYIAKHPDKEGKDIEMTKEYCQSLSDRPTTIVNFVEGTRYTDQKAKKSNYSHLLRPKAGGIAVILKSLSGKMTGILNTTIVYENPNQTLWDFMIRKTKKIKVKVDFIPIAEVPLGDYFNNANDKKTFQNWLNNLWLKNDKYIDQELSN